VIFILYKGSVMKKILIVAAAALCFAGNSFAQENPGGDDASGSALGPVTKPVIVGTTVGLGVLAAMVSNNRGGSKIEPGPGPGPDPDPECGAGEELVDGECVPVTPTSTLTTTVTATSSVTSSVTTPVTVSASVTSL
jgi:hypothetical protein